MQERTAHVIVTASSGAPRRARRTLPAPAPSPAPACVPLPQSMVIWAMRCIDIGMYLVVSPSRTIPTHVHIGAKRQRQRRDKDRDRDRDRDRNRATEGDMD